MMPEFVTATNKRSFSVSFLLCVLLLFGCTRLDRTNLGGNLIPGSDRLITDTLELSVETIPFIENDTTVVGKRDQHLIGFLADPMLGTTTAITYFQTLPPGYPFRYPVSKDSLFLDSVVLSIAFNGTYGDTAAVSRVNVYKITDPTFRGAGRYPTTRGFQFSTGDLLGSQSFTSATLRRGYKLAFRNDSIFNQLRVRLDDSFGRLLLDQDNVSGAFRNDTIFKQFLNGLAVVPDSTTSGSALHYFTLNNAQTKLNLYFRAQRGTTTFDTTVAEFRFVADTIRSANANKIHRNYTGSLAAPVLASNTPTSLVYAQAAPGTGFIVRVPGLDTLAGKPYIIHRAEILARQIWLGPTLLENALFPPVLHAFTVGAGGRNTSIPFDSLSYFQPSSFDFFRNNFLYNILISYTGGTPSFRRDVNGNTVAEYRLNFTRFAQNIVNRNTTRRDFRITAPHIAEFANSISSSTFLNPVAFGRVQLGGGSHPQQPMKVLIYYSKQ